MRRKGQASRLALDGAAVTLVATDVDLQTFAAGLSQNSATGCAALEPAWSNDWIAYYTLFAV
jgi:hypothetical protein